MITANTGIITGKTKTGRKGGRTRPQDMYVRVVAVIRYFKKHQRVSYSDALYKLGIGPRSFRRDIDGLRRAGFEIQANGDSSFTLLKAPL